MNKWMIRGIYFFVVIGLGLMVFMVPPLQKPDEVLHFQRAATGVEKVFYGKDNSIKYRLVDFIKKTRASEVAFKYEQKIGFKEFFYRDNNKEVVDSKDGQYSLSIGYFPSILGVFIGSFSTYPIWTIWWGRLLGGILFALSIYFSVYLLRKSQLKYLIVSYSVLPMVWQQVTTIGHDVLQLVLAPVILSLMIVISKKTINWKYILAYYIAVIVLLLSKSGYQVMGLLLLFPIFKIFEKSVSKYWLAIVLPLLFVFFIFRVGLSQMFLSFLPSVMTGQKEILVNDPGYVLNVVQKTVTTEREFYLRGLLGFFGWLDYSFGLYQYVIIVACVLFLFSFSLRKPKLIISKLNLLILGLMVLLTFYSIIFAFYFGWTRAGKEIVSGPQGRYFLVLIPFLLFFINQLFALIGKRKFYFLIATFFMIIIVKDLHKSINDRYYNMNEVYENSTEIINKKNGEYNQPLVWEKIENRLNFNIPSLKNKYIVGIQMDVKTENNNRSYPYKLIVSNSDCNKNIKTVYTDFDLIKDGLYFHKIEPIKMTDDVACIQFIELVKSSGNSLLINKGINDFVFSLIYRKD